MPASFKDKLTGYSDALHAELKGILERQKIEELADALIEHVQNNNLGVVNSLLAGIKPDRLTGEQDYKAFRGRLKQASVICNQEDASQVLQQIFTWTRKKRREMKINGRPLSLFTPVGQSVLEDILKTEPGEEFVEVPGESFVRLLYFNLAELNLCSGEDQNESNHIKKFICLAVKNRQLSTAIALCAEKGRLLNYEAVATVSAAADKAYASYHPGSEERKKVAQCFENLFDQQGSPGKLVSWLVDKDKSAILKRLKGPALGVFLERIQQEKPRLSDGVKKEMFDTTFASWQAGDIPLKTAVNIWKNFGCMDILFDRRSPHFDQALLQEFGSAIESSVKKERCDASDASKMLLKAYGERIKREVAEAYFITNMFKRLSAGSAVSKAKTSDVCQKRLDNHQNCGALLKSRASRGGRFRVIADVLLAVENSEPSREPCPESSPEVVLPKGFRRA